jgi:hypothetical protein
MTSGLRCSAVTASLGSRCCSRKSFATQRKAGRICLVSGQMELHCEWRLDLRHRILSCLNWKLFSWNRKVLFHSAGPGIESRLLLCPHFRQRKASLQTDSPLTDRYTDCLKGPKFTPSASVRISMAAPTVAFWAGDSFGSRSCIAVIRASATRRFAPEGGMHSLQEEIQQRSHQLKFIYINGHTTVYITGIALRWASLTARLVGHNRKLTRWPGVVRGQRT